MNVFDILIELEATSSKLEKAAIFEKHKKDELFKRVCFMTYDPFTNYYIKKIPLYKMVEDPYLDLDSALDELSDLSARIVTGNKAIERLTFILSHLKTPDAVVIERIISRDLKIGASENTINRCWKDLIPVYPVMLATAYEQKLIDKLKFPLIVQTKFDGMRFNAIVHMNSVELRARSGKEILLLGNLEQEFLELADGMNIVFDGELLVRRDGVVLSRQEGNGILNKSVKGTIGPDEAAMVVCTIWDAILYENFMSGHCGMNYHDRMGMIDYPTTDKISIANSKFAQNLEDVNRLFDLAILSGEEGILLKDPLAGWEDKRVKHQLKFKNELECDLVCTDWQEGTGRITGLLGALVLESADQKLKVSVGTGFSDELRNTITKKDVVGKVITVKYNSLIKNQNGETSLFLPVFIEIREDKKKADALKDIK